MKPITVALGICLLLAASPAGASLVLTLDNPVQTGAPGSVVEFK